MEVFIYSNCKSLLRYNCKIVTRAHLTKDIICCPHVDITNIKQYRRCQENIVQCSRHLWRHMWHWIIELNVLDLTCNTWFSSTSWNDSVTPHEITLVPRLPVHKRVHNNITIYFVNPRNRVPKFTRISGSRYRRENGFLKIARSFVSHYKCTSGSGSTS